MPEGWSQSNVEAALRRTGAWDFRQASVNPRGMHGVQQPSLRSLYVEEAGLVGTDS